MYPETGGGPSPWSVHSVGVSGFALLIGRARSLSRSGRDGGTPDQHQDEKVCREPHSPPHPIPSKALGPGSPSATNGTLWQPRRFGPLQSQDRTDRERGRDPRPPKPRCSSPSPRIDATRGGTLWSSRRSDRREFLGMTLMSTGRSRRGTEHDTARLRRYRPDDVRLARPALRWPPAGSDPVYPPILPGSIDPGGLVDNGDVSGLTALCGSRMSSTAK